MNKKNKKNKKNKGFSLVELIIVIAIMAILAGVMVPQFVKYLSESRRSADIDQAQNIYNAVATLYAQEGVDNDPTTAVLSDDGNWHEVDAGLAGSLNMGNAQPTSKVNSGEVFWYQIDTTGSDIKVGIAATGATPVVVVPTVTAGSDWD